MSCLVVAAFKASDATSCPVVGKSLSDLLYRRFFEDVDGLYFLNLLMRFNDSLL
jgi:hypothetical protein